MMSFGISKRAVQAVVSLVGLAAIWQIASLFFPPFLFPPVTAIAKYVWEILTSWEMFLDVLMTSGRIFGGLMGAFVVGGILALLLYASRTIENYISPILTFLQGIPALSWVVIAIIWFHGVEFRIFFIMLMTTLPAFTFQILGAIRSMSKDLYEMVLSFRPRRMQLFRMLYLPTLIPDIITAWRVNLGNAARVVVVAELVGATGGVGYQLLRQQQLFDMAGALAWTLQLVLFVLVMQQILNLLENYFLRYRAVSERA